MKLFSDQEDRWMRPERKFESLINQAKIPNFQMV